MLAVVSSWSGSSPNRSRRCGSRAGSDAGAPDDAIAARGARRACVLRLRVRVGLLGRQAADARRARVPGARRQPRRGPRLRIPAAAPGAPEPSGSGVRPCYPAVPRRSSSRRRASTRSAAIKSCSPSSAPLGVWLIALGGASRRPGRGRRHRGLDRGALSSAGVDPRLRLLSETLFMALAPRPRAGTGPARPRRQRTGPAAPSARGMAAAGAASLAVWRRSRAPLTCSSFCCSALWLLGEAASAATPC